MWDFNIQLLILSRGNKVEEAAGLFAKRQDAASTIAGLDASAPRTAKEKAELLLTAEIQEVVQERQLENSDAVVVLEGRAEISALSEHADSFQGIKSGDDAKMRRQYWEFQLLGQQWRKLQSTVSENKYFGGLESVIDWSEDGYLLARRQGLGGWHRRGIAVSQMSSLPCFFIMVMLSTVTYVL
jgi:hypothetical protein